MEAGSSQICDRLGFLTSLSFQPDCRRLVGGPRSRRAKAAWRAAREALVRDADAALPNSFR